jgi:hypothetical protein
MLVTLNIILSADADIGRGSRMRVRIKTSRMRSGYYFVHPRRGLSIRCIRVNKVQGVLRNYNFLKETKYSIVVYVPETNRRISMKLSTGGGDSLCKLSCELSSSACQSIITRNYTKTKQKFIILLKKTPHLSKTLVGYIK